MNKLIIIAIMAIFTITGLSAQSLVDRVEKVNTTYYAKKKSFWSGYTEVGFGTIFAKNLYSNYDQSILPTESQTFDYHVYLRSGIKYLFAQVDMTKYTVCGTKETVISLPLGIRIGSGKGVSLTGGYGLAYAISDDLGNDWLNKAFGELKFTYGPLSLGVSYHSIIDSKDSRYDGYAPTQSDIIHSNQHYTGKDFSGQWMGVVAINF